MIHAESLLPILSDAVRARLGELAEAATSGRERQTFRDAVLDFERVRSAWVEGTRKAWRKAMLPPTATARVRMDASSLELIGDEVVEQKILSSRLSLAILEKATWELNELRVRMQHLEGGAEMAPEDVLRPEAVSQLLVEQWTANGLSRQTWLTVQDLIQKLAVERLLAAYKQVNEFLVKNGVVPDIAENARVKRGAEAPARHVDSGRGNAEQANGPAGQQGAGGGSSSGGGGGGAGGISGGGGGGGGAGSGSSGGGHAGGAGSGNARNDSSKGFSGTG
ncbi:MAG: DUF1631 family protein, partial [Ramlibacter sp.]